MSTDLRPHDCEICHCRQWQWNGAPSMLLTDPPSTCVCGHLTSKHHFLSRDAREAAVVQAPLCIRCKATESAGLCCSSHNAALCHGCYRVTHFVEVCVTGCSACEREGLDPKARVPR